MDNSKIYSTAKELAEKVSREKPCYAGLETAVLISDKGTFLGVTGINVADGRIVDVPADIAAFMNMRNSGGRTALGLAVIKLADMSFVQPSEEALELMFRTNTENDGCLVCLGKDESKLLSALRLGADSDSMMDGFDFDDAGDRPAAHSPAADSSRKYAAANTTANVISGVAVDESNPFYEKTADVASPEETLSVMSEEQKEDALKNMTGAPDLTTEELLKQAKKRKGVAKSNFLFRKKHKEG
ncbi:MAG: hypothetical protein IK093_10010 [Ruminiclostridium sp.]|nr:hypothetical protein [Ruminiclostridium sp.]